MNVRLWHADAPSPVPPPGCDGFVASSAWAGLLERHRRVRAPLWIAHHGDALVGACLAYHQRAAGAAATLFIPRFGLWGSDEVKRCLLEAAADYAGAIGIRRGVAALGGAPGKGWRCWEKTTVTLAVHADEETLFANLRKKSRYTIRKAREMFEVADGAEHLAAFHRVYAARMEEKGLTLNSLDFLQDAFDSVDGLELLVAVRDGQVRAGMLFAMSGDAAYYLFNGASPDALANNANHLLMWEAMRRFATRGVTRIDLGESLNGGGVYAFKTVQFGGIPTPVTYCDPLCAEGTQSAPVHLPPLLRAAHRLAGIIPGPFQRRLAEAERDYGRLL